MTAPRKPAGSTTTRSRSRAKPQANGQLSVRSEAILMTDFLAEAETNALYGTRRTVSLGQMPGFPNYTDDPEVVQRAIDVITQKAETASTRLVELKYRQRVITLRHALDSLRAAKEPSKARAWFLEHGLAWCKRQTYPYDWEVLHEMGVDKRTLKDAGFRVPGVRARKE